MGDFVEVVTLFLFNKEYETINPWAAPEIVAVVDDYVVDFKYDVPNDDADNELTYNRRNVSGA